LSVVVIAAPKTVGTWQAQVEEGFFEEADLDRLLDDLKQDKLAPREGFFFGEQEIRMADFVSAYGFVGLAKSLIAMDKDIYYDSWW